MNIRMHICNFCKVKSLCIALIILILLSGCTSEKEILGIPVISEMGVAFDEIIEEDLSLLPEVFREKIKEDGFRIVVTSGQIEDLYDDFEKDEISGLTDLESKTIYVEENEPEALLHELCHAICYNKNKESSLYIYYEGCEIEQKNSGMEDYYKDNYDEYIVECMSLYLKDKNALDEFPITKYTVIEMLSGKEWIYGED